MVFHYLKTIESLDNLSPAISLFNIIGTIKNLKDRTPWGETEFKFTLYSDDTDVCLECTLNKGNIEAGNTHYNNGDSVIVSGYYYDEELLVYKIHIAPLGLTGNMSRDMLILWNEINSLISIQGQNRYISEDAWGKLQDSLFKFKEVCDEINFLGGETFEDRISRK